MSHGLHHSKYTLNIPFSSVNSRLAKRRPFCEFHKLKPVGFCVFCEFCGNYPQELKPRTKTETYTRSTARRAIARRASAA